MKSTKRKRIRRSIEELQTAAERQAVIELVRQRRGSRVDFTQMKLNSTNDISGKLRKVVRCVECGQKGVVCKALLPSFLIIHRGTLKEDKFSMTEYCVCSSKEGKYYQKAVMK